MKYSSRYATCAGREIHYTEWGSQHSGTVIAWHGLARTGRDMDELAEHLSQPLPRDLPGHPGARLQPMEPRSGQRVPRCPSTPGSPPTLFDQLGIERGALGRHLDGRRDRHGLRGRAVPAAAQGTHQEPGAQRQRAAAGRRRRWRASAPTPAIRRPSTRWRELEAFFRQVYKPFGWLSDAQWRRLTETSTRRLPDGRVTPHYDPAMVRQFIDHPNDYDLWAHYDAIEVPVLCLRGAESDLVLPDATEEMMRRGPGLQGLARIVEIPGCGHAPALNVPEQLDLVASFIERTSEATLLPSPPLARRTHGESRFARPGERLGIGQLAGGPAGEVLLRHVAQRRDPGRFVVQAGDVVEVLAPCSQEGLAALLRDFFQGLQAVAR